MTQDGPVATITPATTTSQATTSPTSLTSAPTPPALKPAHKTRTGSAQAHLAAGFTSGLTSSVLLQPLDLLKTRIQQQKKNPNGSSSSSSSSRIIINGSSKEAAAAAAATAESLVPGKSLRAALREIDSVAALWRGTSASAIRTSVGSALYLTTLNATRTYLARHTSLGAQSSSSSSRLPKLSMYANLASGAAVRGLVGVVTMPVTVVKVRFESSLFAYTSLADAVRDIYTRHGVAGFFKGTGVTFLRDAPNAGLYVLFYELWKDVLSRSVALFSGPNQQQQQQKDTKLLNTSTSALINSSAAILSAGMATTITGPFDTVKTRMQLDPVRYKSVWTAARLIVADEGLVGLFDGLSLRMARKALSAGISWCIYEELVRRM
ncbi:uncharacterized protein SAPINGB_P005042 [Magnusiomyces paraingens]|uniref:Mitochondrial glycine transporter n=1 Tax=Magnusiomyces paraingens TaxID=2606893 RepID=A0A5E8C5E2_9ASCO|nr:uncharacterized protein SAPINGB_P005042 [Saprochaete ingens]VVT56406.1 unnamed protein product [Saprochaete ingens]